MIISRNERYIKRRKTLGQYSGYLAILILGGGMYVSFRYQEQIIFSFLALIFGFTLSQISVFYTNRFGRSPRPDQELENALKGLDDRYVLYHYRTAVSHLLVGPAGVLILLPYYQKGKITYDEKKKRWKRAGGNAYLRFFAQDSIGRPSLDIAAAKKDLTKELLKIPDFELPELRAVLIFSNEKAEVEADNAPEATLHISQVKKYVRKEAKSDRSLSMPVVKTVQDALGLPAAD
jgi:hypothetical protein